MTKDLVLKPKGMDVLSPAEMGALHAMFASNRQRCRKVMHYNWWHKDTTELYRRVVMEFQQDDPLFSDAVRHRERVAAGYPYK